MTVGRTYAPEWRDYPDPPSSRRGRRFANSPVENYHPYFYNPSFTAARRQVIFISNRTGTSNVYLTDGDGDS